MKKFHSEEPKGLHLEWVPLWEGKLKYCPDDLKNDVPLRFWHCYYHKKYKRWVCNEMNPSVVWTNSYRGKYRRRLHFKHHGKEINVLCSYLTIKTFFAFEPTDRRKNVVMHLNDHQMDDRPSNLEWGTQKENIAMSRKVKEMNRLKPAERHRIAKARQKRIEKLRLHVIAALGPDATRTDVEVQVTQLLDEHEDNLDEFLARFDEKGGADEA